MVIWFADRPVATALVMLLLMWVDWWLTVLTEAARRRAQSGHYRMYPVDTTEGNPLLHGAVAKQRVIDAKHIVAALVLSTAVAFSLTIVRREWRPLFIGYVWGLFLIVSCTHLGNLAGYRLGSRGIHGTLWMHLRTAYAVQMGRYAALASLLMVIALLSESAFTAGVAGAGFTSAFRQLVWIRTAPTIGIDDTAPAGASEGFDSPSQSRP